MEYSETSSDIAIIGMSGRFPGARDLGEFWELLRTGKEGLQQFSKQDLLAQGIDEEIINNPQYKAIGGVIPDYDKFDAEFFGYKPHEATLLDPQYRIFLEESWKAIETAGYNPDSYQGRIGVFAGCKQSAVTYLQYCINGGDTSKITPFEMGVYAETSQLATRVSYDLNLTGPSVQIQTACSTSLVAIHMACMSLLNGDTDIVLAGGVTNFSAPISGYLYKEGLVYSADGKCRSFDQSASGTIMTNGVGIIVLKRLQDALDDNDHIDAIIKSTAINNDGRAKVGYTAPSVEGQAKAIATAITLANIDAETINYIEAHGTATIVGDPIEVTALTQAFQQFTTKTNFCAIGSVKTNIGHLDVAAGVAGVIKTVLAMKNKFIPANIHFTKPNAAINFDETPFYVNQSGKEWLQLNQNIPRRAGISAFGIGGTNAHVILEEAPIQHLSYDEDTGSLLCISAKTPSALRIIKQNLITFMNSNEDCTLTDMAYTLHVGRQQFKYRAYVVCRNVREAITKLNNIDLDDYQSINVSNNIDATNVDLDELIVQCGECSLLSQKVVLLEKLGKLWVSGMDINFNGLYLKNKTHRIKLPVYPFEAKKYWYTKAKITNHVKVFDEQHDTHMFTAMQVEDEVKKIWCNIFGRVDLPTNASFFDIDGDSIDAAKMTNLILDRFSVKIHVSWIYTYDTIRKQIKKLCTELRKIDSLNEADSLSKHKTTDATSIFAFNEANADLSLFLVHPSRAGAEVYINLVNKLDKSIDIYGIESHNLYCEPGKYIQSISELAKKYIEELKKTKAHGPYFLGGWSMGGIIAYEMARHLKATGDTVLNVFMLDACVTTQCRDAVYSTVPEIMKKIALSNKSYSQEYRERLEKVIEVECHMLANYKIYPQYEGNVTLFKANNILQLEQNDELSSEEVSVFNEMFRSLSIDKHNGWQSCLPKLETINVNCCHESIMNPDNLDIVAYQINRQLQSCFEQVE